jgi:CheY-like chemotaxis protein
VPDRKRPAVLVVEDDPLLARSVESCIGTGGEVVTAATAVEALGALSERTFDIVVIDLLLADQTSGIDVIEHLATLEPSRRPVAVVLTGASPRELARIDRDVVKAVFIKPANIEAVCEYVIRVWDLQHPRGRSRA